jgi:hypothetical protein
VEFSAPAQAGAQVVLKTGGINVTGTSLNWASDRRSVRITRTSAYAAGEYTVTVSDSSKTFTVQAEKLTAISITAQYVFPMDNQDLKVVFTNQYGGEMPLTAYTNFTLSAVCQAKPSVTLNLNKTAAGFILKGAQGLAANDSVNIVIAENTTGTAVTKSITLSESPKITAFAFGQVQLASGATVILVNSSGHSLTVDAKDQYNQAYTILPSDIGLNKPVILTSNDSAIIDASKITVANGKLNFPIGAIGSKEGTVTLTAVGQNISSSIQITVKTPAAVKTLTITGVEGTVFVNQWVPLVVTAKDQYGNPTTLDTLDPTKLMMFSTNTTVVPNTNIQFNGATKKIEIKGNASGSATLHISYDGITQGTLDVQVLEAPVPTYITNVTMPIYYQKNSTIKMTADMLKIADQYEKEIALTPAHSVIVTSSDISGTKFTEGTMTGAGYTMSAPATSGSYTLTFTLKKGASTVNTYDMTVLVVDDDKIVSYRIEPISTMYGGATDTVTDTGHWKPIKIVGLLANGKSVNLAYTGTLPTGIDQITCTNDSGANNFVIEDVSGVKTLKAQNVTQTMTTTIKLWKTGQEITSLNVTASGAAPTLTHLAATEPNVTKALSGGVFNITAYVDAKDQYGVPMAFASITGSKTFMSSKTSVAVVNSTGIVTPVATGSCQITIYFAGADKTLIINLTVN